MKSATKNAILIAASSLLLLAGIVFAIRSLTIDTLSPWPFVCIGLGSGMLGAAIGQAQKRRNLSKDEDFEEQMRIAQQDERNVAVFTRAKAKAFSVSIYLYAALMLAFLLLRIHYVAILLLTGVYLATIVCYIVFFQRYSKTM